MMSQGGEGGCCETGALQAILIKYIKCIQPISMEVVSMQMFITIKDFNRFKK